MESRVKIEMEFFIKSSPTILFNYIGSASGLSEWFADNVSVRGENKMVFSWEDEGESEAEVVKITPKKSIRFRWTDTEDTAEYWEMEIHKDDLTNDVVLRVTDFAYADEESYTRDLWASQIDALKANVGAL